MVGGQLLAVLPCGGEGLLAQVRRRHCEVDLGHFVWARFGHGPMPT